MKENKRFCSMRRGLVLLAAVSVLLMLCAGLALAQETATSPEQTSKIINTDLIGKTGGLVSISHVLLLQMVSFLVFAYLMGRFAFTPIRNFMKWRAEKVAEEIRLAEEKNKQAERSFAEATEEMDRVKREAYDIIQRSRDDARRAREEILEEAKVEGKKAVEAARGEIERERVKAVEEIRTQVGDLAISVAERLLERQVTPEDNKRLIEETLKDSGRLM